MCTHYIALFREIELTFVFPLITVKRLWDVAYHFNEEFNILYLTARKTKTSEPEIYITLSVLQDVSIEDIEQLQRALLTES